jgi:hypothetical protein
MPALDISRASLSAAALASVRESESGHEGQDYYTSLELLELF